jgi:hypothetical protein
VVAWGTAREVGLDACDAFHHGMRHGGGWLEEEERDWIGERAKEKG